MISSRRVVLQTTPWTWQRRVKDTYKEFLLRSTSTNNEDSASTSSKATKSKVRPSKCVTEQRKTIYLQGTKALSQKLKRALSQQAQPEETLSDPISFDPPGDEVWEESEENIRLL